jgi:hypothetical protein
MNTEDFARKIVEIIDAQGDNNLDTITTIEALCVQVIEKEILANNDLEEELKSIGDIPSNKRFYLTMSHYAYNDRLNWETCILKPPFKLDNRRYVSILDEVRAVAVECIDFTAHIRETLINDNGLGVFYSIPPESDNNIADAVFDVQTFKVDVFLSTELINAGLMPTKADVRFVNDFE